MRLGLGFSALARAITGGAEPPPVVLPGIGSVVMDAGQRYMSTLPENAFIPTHYGWELYGEEL